MHTHTCISFILRVVGAGVPPLFVGVAVVGATVDGIAVVGVDVVGVEVVGNADAGDTQNIT